MLLDFQKSRIQNKLTRLNKIQKNILQKLLKMPLRKEGFIKIDRFTKNFNHFKQINSFKR